MEIPGDPACVSLALAILASAPAPAVSGFAAGVAATDRARHAQYGADSFFDQTGLLTNFERSHWAGEKPYDRDRANYIKNAVEKAGREIWKVGGCYRKSQTSCHETKRLLSKFCLGAASRMALIFLEREDIGREANTF